MTTLRRKKLFSRGNSVRGKEAARVSVSLYPSHMDVLAEREQLFNLHRSVCIQILLELEQRDGLIRQELLRRLSPTTDTTKPTTTRN
jgi:hypothetical protein